MLDFLFAVGQFVCGVGLLAGLFLALAEVRRAMRDASHARAVLESQRSSDPRRAQIELAVLPEKPAATLTVVPIESGRLLSARKAGSSGKSAELKAPRRRSTRAGSDGARNEERAVLLMKNARKRPGANGPRAV